MTITVTGVDRTPVTGARVIDGVLQVVGTSGNDEVAVGKLAWSNQYIVIADFLPGCWHMQKFDAAGIERIEVILGDGNDLGVIAGNVSLPVTLNGGNGDDLLKAEVATISSWAAMAAISWWAVAVVIY